MLPVALKLKIPYAYHLVVIIIVKFEIPSKKLLTTTVNSRQNKLNSKSITVTCFSMSHLPERDEFSREMTLLELEYKLSVRRAILCGFEVYDLMSPECFIGLPAEHRHCAHCVRLDCRRPDESCPMVTCPHCGIRMHGCKLEDHVEHICSQVHTFSIIFNYIIIKL